MAIIRGISPEADGNNMGFRRKGVEEKSRESLIVIETIETICMKFILAWITSVGWLDDRIDGFPQ